MLPSDNKKHPGVDIKKLKKGTYEYPSKPRPFVWMQGNKSIKTCEFSEDGEFEDMPLKEYYRLWAERLEHDDFILARKRDADFSYHYCVVRLKTSEYFVDIEEE